MLPACTDLQLLFINCFREIKNKCKYQSGSAKRTEKRRSIQIGTPNTAPIASLFEKNKNVESDAEDTPNTSSLVDESQLSTSNEGVDGGSIKKSAETSNDQLDFSIWPMNSLLTEGTSHPQLKKRF
jgi:hypothetical protein